MENTSIMTPEALQKAANEYRHYSRIMEDAAAILDSIKDAMKAHMTASGTDSIKGTDFLVTWKPVKGSKLDRDGIEAAYPGILDAYTIPNPSRRFNFK